MERVFPVSFKSGTQRWKPANVEDSTELSRRDYLNDQLNLPGEVGSDDMNSWKEESSNSKF